LGESVPLLRCFTCRLVFESQVLFLSVTLREDIDEHEPATFEKFDRFALGRGAAVEGMRGDVALEANSMNILQAITGGLHDIQVQSLCINLEIVHALNS